VATAIPTNPHTNIMGGQGVGELEARGGESEKGTAETGTHREQNN